MKNCTNLTALAATALIAMAGQAAAQDLMIRQDKDPATGATVRVYRTNTGPRVDVETAAVSIRKEVAGGKVITSLSGHGESLVIGMDERTITVSGTRGKATASRGDATGLARAKHLVAASPLTARAAALISKMGFGDASALQPLLLTTRAFLLAASDDESGMRELSNWMRAARARVHVIKAGGAQKTPTDCWKGYGDEILAAFDDYLECYRNLPWWDPFGEKRCAVVYEVRIIGAFTWYAGCVSIGSIIRG